MSATGLDGHYRDLKRGLAALPPRHQLLFAASGAEVLKPNYRLFVAETGWGNADFVELCIEKVWKCVSRQTVSSSEVSDLIERSKKVAPDTEMFEQASTSAALNAVSATVSALKACASPSIEYAIDAATAVIDTIWGYVQIHEEMDPNDPALEKKILRDPLMDGELVRQRQLLQTLRTMPALDATTIEDIRQSSVALVIRWK